MEAEAAKMREVAEATERSLREQCLEAAAVAESARATQKRDEEAAAIAVAQV